MMELYIAIAVEWIVCLVVVILIVRAARRDEARGEARLREVEAAAQARVAAAQAALKRSVVLVKPGVAPEVVRDELIDLYRAMNEYHMAHGAGVLSLEDFHRFVRAETAVEV